MLEMVTMVDFASYAGEPWNQSYVDLDPLFFVISAENSLQWHPELDLVHAVCLELFHLLWKMIPLEATQLLLLNGILC